MKTVFCFLSLWAAFSCQSLAHASERTFYRAININGPALTIDGNFWEGQEAPNYSITGIPFSAQNVSLEPPTDDNRAAMIRSSYWSGNGLEFIMSAVPVGVYEVYLYVWEDNDNQAFDILLEGEVIIAGHNSGSPGHWDKLGPWQVQITDGDINIGASADGHANFSGVEVWQVDSKATFHPTDDAYVRSSAPAGNFGADSSLRVRNDASAQVHSYLKFNVSELSGVVQSAKVRVKVADDSNEGGSIYAVSNNYFGTSTSWTEKGLKWNNAPAIAGSVLDSVGKASLGQTLEFDVTAAIAGNGDYSFGLKKRSANAVFYSAKEGFAAPELVIQTAGGGSVSQPPNAMAAANPTSGLAPLTVQFAGSGSTDSDGTIASYAWTFGDGGTAAVADPQYTYNTAGNYNARLIVTDDRGARDTAFVQIQVQAPIDCKFLPDAAAYGRITGGDQLHADKVTYCFQGVAGNMPMTYQVYDSDYNGEIVVLLNGQKILDVQTGPNNDWSTDRTAVLPDSLVLDGVSNILEFDNPKNPPNILLWGVRQVSVPPASTVESHWLETEFPGTITPPMQIANDPAASQGRFIWVPDGSVGGQATYNLNISQAGNYKLVGRVLSPGTQSFFVEIDDGGDKLWDTYPTSTWAWDHVNDRGVADPVIFFLTAGAHTIKIKYREFGEKLDKILVTNDMGFIPTGEGEPAENVPVINQPPQAVATANPTGGTAPLTVQFNGSGSNDPDGSVTSYLWNFGDGDSAAIANPQHTYGSGTYLARLIVADNQGAKDTAFVTIDVAAAVLPAVRVNCGGSQYAATNGRVFAADQMYRAGSWGFADTSLNDVYNSFAAISGTSDPALYKSQRMKVELAYLFDLPNGAYDVILHFAELQDNESGRRVMDIFAEGNLVLNDFDIWAATGGRNIATTRLISAVNVTDGQLTLKLIRSVATVKRRPAIAAIEVGPAGTLAKPAITQRPQETAISLPEKYALEQNYPNPFNPSTNISFVLPEAGEVRLMIYNSVGQPMRKPLVRYHNAGRNTIRLNASNWPSGAYFYEIKVNNFRAVRRMILSR